MPHLESTSSWQRRTFPGRSGWKDFIIYIYHRYLAIILDQTVNFMRDCLCTKVNRDETSRILQIHTKWFIWGVENKAVYILCARSMNKGNTSIRMTRHYLITLNYSSKSQHQCHQIDSTIIQNLSMSALGPTYCIYARWKFLKASDPSIKRLLSSRYGRLNMKNCKKKTIAHSSLLPFQSATMIIYRWTF